MKNMPQNFCSGFRTSKPTHRFRGRSGHPSREEKSYPKVSTRSCSQFPFQAHRLATTTVAFHSVGSGRRHWPESRCRMRISQVSPVSQDRGIDAYIKSMYAKRMERTNIYLSASQMKRLEVLRKRSGGTMAEQVRRAIDFWLDAEERKIVARHKAKAATK